MAAFDDPEALRAVLDSLTTGVYVVDRTGKVVFWSAGAERITGHLSQDVLGHSAKEDFLGQVDRDNNEISGEATALAGVLKDGKVKDTQVSLRHKSGHRVQVRLHTAPIRNEHGSMIGAMQSFEDVLSSFDWEQRQSKLAEYGCIDQASGVLNHGMVQSHLREALATFTEHPVPFCILCIGIDNLDAIRTRHGAGAIANVLRMVGQTLENSLRPTDFLGRWMENEFLAILMECTAAEVGRAGERLRKMVGQSKVEWWGDVMKVTVSMGAACAQTGETVEGMLERAESGLKRSVEQGGNCMTLSNT